MTYFWLTLAVIAAVVEIVTPQLVSLWFCIGALIAMASAALGAELWLQITVFVISSVALIFITRPLYKKYIKPSVVATNADALIGQTAIVTEAIDNDAYVGQAKVSGQVWSALSENGKAIPEGTKVVIKSISGVKLIVSPADAE